MSVINNKGPEGRCLVVFLEVPKNDPNILQYVRSKKLAISGIIQTTQKQKDTLKKQEPNNIA